LNVIEFHDGALHHHLKHQELKKGEEKPSDIKVFCFINRCNSFFSSCLAREDFCFPFPTQPETLALKVKFMNWT